MLQQRNVQASKRQRFTSRAPSSRRAVSSVLSMMFLVLFGSLAAAMAVVAHGNLRTADSSLKVSRAMSAAETGLVFATQRLQGEAARFVITKGSVEGQLVDQLWMAAPCSGDCGTVQYLEDNGDLTGSVNFGIVHMLRDRFLNDNHSITPEPGDDALPTLNGDSGSLTVRPIALSGNDDGSPSADGPYFRLRFELLDPTDYEEFGHVRVTSQGVYGGVRRTLQTDVHITKKIEYAVLSPNRIMIGKNVSIEGPIGSVYGTESGELEAPNSHPLRMISDFYHLDSGLDSSLDQFYTLVAQSDVDGDNQLRPGHPVEGPAVTGGGFADYTGDGFVSDFDLLLAAFGGGGSALVYDAALAGQSTNFNADPELSRLIDLYNPDRDGDEQITANDHALGYKDGVLDWLDDYAKVHGHLAFAITREEWESRNPAITNYREVVQGPIKPRNDAAAASFGVDTQDLLHVTTDMFDSSHSWFSDKAQNDLVSEANSASGSKEVICPEWDDPPDWAASLNCDSTSDELWEQVPFDAAMPYDFYERPVFRNVTFRNVRIPVGVNALFENCTFIGVTYIETTTDNEYENWNISGAVSPPEFAPVFGGDFNEVEYDGDTIEDTKPLSNNIRFHNCTFLGSISGDAPLGYAHWRNKVQMTGETRFYVDPNDPDLLAEDDASTLQSQLTSISASDREELAKSSILMPGWSMDVGAFTTDPNANPDDLPIIKLRGTIVAGILDIRGRADVRGTLLMTFRPKLGDLPLTHSPLDCWSCLSPFSTTIGYLGPEFGDYEGFDPTDPDFEGFGEIRLRYDPDAKLPDGIPWPVRIEAVPNSYFEGGSL